MIDIKAIREAAEAATPGPWVHGSDGRKELNNVSHFIEDCVPKWDRLLKEHLPASIVYGVNRAEDAAHIATANPATVLAMCDEIERLRFANRDLSDWFEAAKADAQRYEFLRANAYIELYCGSPKVDGWKPEMVDAAIDEAMEAKT